MKASYKPNRASREILDAAMAHIQSIPYQTGLRWVFYRLLQDSLISNKSSYKQFKELTSKARKRFYGEWRPWTLIDDGRMVSESDRPATRKEAINSLHLYAQISPKLFDGERVVPFLLFESNTMAAQFEYYAPWADQAAFRGDASVPHKWNIAERCDALTACHGLPVHILYFGDYDPKGLQIPMSAMADISGWANDELKFTRCGISPEQVRRFNIPDKEDKSGTYEWEALPDNAAATVIRESLDAIVDTDRIESLAAEAENETARLQSEVKSKLDEMRGAR